MNFGEALCQICNDYATGYNYSALTCNSCKVFFHRYGFDLNKFTCKRNENCEITFQSRNKCQRCRLLKCFAIGMVRESKRELYMEAVMLNCAAKENLAINSQFYTTEDTELIPKFVMSPYSGLSSMGSSDLQLSDYESYRIKEIFDATATIADETKLPIICKSTNYYDTFSTAEVYIRQFVKFSKRLSTFNLIDKEDQLVIMKPFCFDICTIRLAFMMNFETGSWPVLKDENATEVFIAPFNLGAMSKMVKNHINCFLEYYTFLRELQTELEGDPIIRNLLTTVAMFKYQEENLSSFEFIRYNLILHSRLLQRYLEAKYGKVSKAKQKLTSLIKLAMKLSKMREYKRRLFAEMDKSQIPEIYIQIYDLA